MVQVLAVPSCPTETTVLLSKKATELTLPTWAFLIWILLAGFSMLQMKMWVSREPEAMWRESGDQEMELTLAWWKTQSEILA